jgi:hypothetical protein
MESKSNPIARKGNPSPREYIARSEPPCRADSELKAKVKIPPSTGPTQGVQAMAKRIPTIKERRYPVATLLLGDKRFS